MECTSQKWPHVRPHGSVTFYRRFGLLFMMSAVGNKITKSKQQRLCSELWAITKKKEDNTMLWWKKIRKCGEECNCILVAVNADCVVEIPIALQRTTLLTKKRRKDIMRRPRWNMRDPTPFVASLVAAATVETVSAANRSAIHHGFNYVGN